MNHLMLDLETMGDTSYSSIVAIGAVEFNIITGETGREFYEIVDLESCLQAGLTVTGSTIMWWLQQNHEARMNLVYQSKVSLYVALSRFQMFMQDCPPDIEIWSKPPRFDMSILANAYHKLNFKIPWNHRNERCVRTLISLARNDDFTEIEFGGSPHNVIEDCYHQIHICKTIFNDLYK